MTSTVDLYELADERGYYVYWYTFDDPRISSMSVMDEDRDCHIAVDPYRFESEADERHKMAHELGHCETGSFYNEYAACDVRQKHELRAERWAIKKLLPVEELTDRVAAGDLPWELAEYFNVPQSMVEEAVDYYRMLGKFPY